MGLHGLPNGHDFVHAAAIEIGPDWALQFVDEGMHFFVRLGPVEVTLLVRNVAVKRHDHRVDQLRHSGASYGRVLSRLTLSRLNSVATVTHRARTA